MEADGFEYKIWNEGIPTDIPVLDGHRVVVLGPERIQRSWNGNRAFDGLGSDIELLRAPTPGEFEEWIQRCAAS